MSLCEPYIQFGMAHELMLYVYLCDMSHMLCLEIRNEVAKLPSQTQSLPLHAVVDANPVELHGVGWPSQAKS
jgi:hypothetical protein